MAIAAGPGRMRLGVNVEGESVALLAIGGVGLKLSAVRHHHLDAVIVWVEVLKLLHGCLTGWLSHKTSYAQRAKSLAPRAKRLHEAGLHRGARLSQIRPLILQGWSPDKRAEVRPLWTSGRGLRPLLSPSHRGHSAGRRMCRERGRLARS